MYQHLSVHRTGERQETLPWIRDNPRCAERRPPTEAVMCRLNQKPVNAYQSLIDSRLRLSTLGAQLGCRRTLRSCLGAVASLPWSSLGGHSSVASCRVACHLQLDVPPSASPLTLDRRTAFSSRAALATAPCTEDHGLPPGMSKATEELVDGIEGGEQMYVVLDLVHVRLSVLTASP